MSKKKFSYKPQFGVILIAESEEEQKKLFNSMKKKGLKIRLVNV